MFLILIDCFVNDYVYDPGHASVKKFSDNVLVEILNDETTFNFNFVDYICKWHFGQEFLISSGLKNEIVKPPYFLSHV